MTSPDLFVNWSFLQGLSLQNFFLLNISVIFLSFRCVNIAQLELFFRQFYVASQWQIFIFVEGVAPQGLGPRATKAEECL